MDISKKIHHAASLLQDAKYAIAFTGAGISTASGIPDFRSPGTGLWESSDPFEVASLSAFRKQPEKFFNWIKPLFLQAKTASPNPAHIYLSKMENEGIVKAIITQNIDGLQQQSGANNVIELHGTARTATCPNCQLSFKTDEMFAIFKSDNPLPKCSACGQIIKPDVVLFEELLPEKEWNSASNEMRKADLVFIIGSSLEVYPANILPDLALQNGAKLIINTFSATSKDRRADVVIHSDVATTIPEIYKLLST